MKYLIRRCVHMCEQGDVKYLSESDRDACIQLNVVGQLCKLLLLFLQCL